MKIVAILIDVYEPCLKKMVRSSFFILLIVSIHFVVYSALAVPPTAADMAPVTAQNAVINNIRVANKLKNAEDDYKWAKGTDKEQEKKAALEEVKKEAMNAHLADEAAKDAVKTTKLGGATSEGGGAEPTSRTSEEWKKIYTEEIGKLDAEITEKKSTIQGQKPQSEELEKQRNRISREARQSFDDMTNKKITNEEHRENLASLKTESSEVNSKLESAKQGPRELDTLRHQRQDYLDRNVEEAQRYNNLVRSEELGVSRSSEDPISGDVQGRIIQRMLPEGRVPLNVGATVLDGGSPAFSPEFIWDQSLPSETQNQNLINTMRWHRTLYKNGQLVDLSNPPFQKVK